MVMKFHQTRAFRNRRPQRGVTLIEALVALVVMSFGMVALVGLMGNLRRSGDLAKQRSEAMRLAQAELAELRGFSVLAKDAAAGANVRDYDNNVETPPASRTITLDNANTTFTLTRSVTPLVKDLAEPKAKTVRVTVRWTDRTNAEQAVTLDSIISRTDPVFSLALGVAPPTNGVRQSSNRNPVIPPAAKDLENGTSAFRRGNGDPVVWVINNITGVITGKCEIPTGDVSSLTASSVESCKNNTVGYLISGTIRFATGAVPDPRAPADAAQHLSVRLSLTPSQLRKKVSDTWVLLTGGEYASQPSPACFTDEPSSASSPPTLVNYICVVYPNSQAPRNWWGQVLLDTPLDIGTSSSQFKVCRYSGDYNGNGYSEDAYDYTASVDRIDNEEHPAVYRHVSYSLARQNFLVIRSGDGTSCPLSPVDTTNGYFVDASTYQIQP